MSLRLRLALLSSFLTLLALALLIFSSGLALQRSLLSDLDEELRVQAKVVLDAIREDGELNQIAEDALTTARGSSAAWVYQHNQLIAGAGLVDAPEPLDKTFLLSLKSSQSSSLAGWRVSSLRTGDWLVQVGRPLASNERVLENYLQNSVLYGFLAAIFTGLLTIFLVAQSTMPLDQLARRVAHPTDDLPIPHTHLKDEIGILAKALEQGRLSRLALRQQETRFLANAAHELRTPVSAILAALEVRLGQPSQAEQDRATLEKVAFQARHLRDLAQNLLALTRAERAMSFASLDLLDLAGDVVDLLAPLAVQKNLEIVCLGVSANFQGDAILLARAIENLIANSIKFSDVGSIEIEVGVTWLEVRDTGIGIGLEAQAHILEPFHREGTRDGSGLGLAVVQAVVLAHGGKLELESNAGMGTRVRLVFPTQQRIGT
jgi:two-component system, OmpR family, sensor kinase